MAKSEQSSSSSSSSMVDSAPRPWESYNTVYTNAKAGMEGVDKEKVQRIVYEMSKGSKYFENEERKEAYMKQKIENMRNHLANLKATDISHYQRVADKRIAELDTTRDLSRIWLHVDMDAFYAAVETLSNPSLKGKPMAVGSMSMISTANYEARKFGVRAAMPGFIASKLCPDLIFVPTDFKKYTYYSDLTRKVYHEYDPNFTAASLDEAYLDITKVSDFHWGCGMTHRILNNTAYKKWFASRFTAADFHNELKWYWTEATQGQENYADPDAMIKFADEHGIIVRGHTILWDDVKYNQKWVRKLSPEQLLEAANRRVDSVVNRYKGRLIGWDVMNENLHHNFFEKRLGKNASSLFFNRVHKIDPNAVLFMNEFNTTEHVNDEYAPPVKYLRRMKKIQSFPGNSEVKMGIGLESHYGAEPIDFHYVRSSLDSLSQTGLPIWLTELDVKMDPNLKNWSGLQVIYLEEILRESFSHEAVKAMIIWTGASIDGCDVMCMADENLVNTPIGDLIDGLMEEWRTGEIEAMADFNGSCQVSVFNGGYEVKVVDPVSNASSRVSLKVDKVSIPDKMVHVQIMG